MARIVSSGTRREEVGDQRRRVGQLFEVIQHEQHLALPQVLDQPFRQWAAPHVAEPKRARDRGQEELGVLDGTEGDEIDAVGEPIFRDRPRPEARGGSCPRRLDRSG